MLILNASEQKPLRLFTEDWIESMNYINERINNYSKLFSAGYLFPQEAVVRLTKDQKYVRISPITKGFFASDKFLIWNDFIELEISPIMKESFELGYSTTKRNIDMYKLWLDIEESEKTIIFDKDPFEKKHKYKHYLPKLIITGENVELENKSYLISFMYNQEEEYIMDITEANNTAKAIPRFKNPQQGQILFFHENFYPEKGNQSLIQLRDRKYYSMKDKFKYYKYFVRTLQGIASFMKLKLSSPISMTRREDNYLLTLNEDDIAKDLPKELVDDWVQIRYLKIHKEEKVGYFSFTSRPRKNEWILLPILRDDFEKDGVNMTYKEGLIISIPDKFVIPDYENNLNELLMKHNISHTKVYLNIDF